MHVLTYTVKKNHLLHHWIKNMYWVHSWTKNRKYLNIKCVLISNIIFGLFPSAVRGKGYGYLVKTHWVSQTIQQKLAL